MQISIVPWREVFHTWPHVEEFFAEVIPHAKGDFTLEQLRTDIFQDRMSMMVAREGAEYAGAAAMSFQNRRNHRVAHIHAVGGRMVSTDQVWEQLKMLCLANGATEIECATYAAAQRLWSRFGFEEKYRVLGVKL